MSATAARRIEIGVSSALRPARRLSGLERAWLTADSLEPPFAFALVFEGRGDLSEARWRDALDRASAANPGCRVRLAGVLGWTRWEITARTPTLRAVESDWDGRSPAGAAFLERPFDARGGEVVEVVLLPGDEARPDRVAVRVLHAAMDGRGVLAFAEDLLAAVNGREPIGSAAGPQTDAGLARDAGGQPAEAPPRTWASPTGPASATRGGTTWARVSLDGSFKRLLPRAVAALWAASRAHTDGPLRLEIPVDLRRHAPGLRSTANLSGIFPLTLEAPPDLQSLDAAIRQAVEGLDYCGAPLRAGIARWLPLSLLARGGRDGAAEGLETDLFEVSATLSNMGRLALETLGGPVFAPERAYIIPPGNQGLPLLMVLTGHERGLEICAAGPLALCGEGRLEALLTAMAEALRG